MSTEPPRRYRPPTHLSMTLPQYKQFLNPPNLTSSPLRDIPEPQDLFHIKEDLENMANEPETRAKSLQRDLEHLIENVKIHDQEQPKRAITGGKNMNVVMERIRKQERASLAAADDSQENNGLRHNASRVSKNQLERQAALEALKKRRRRDDTDDEQVVSIHNPKAKSASPSLDENKFSNYQQELRKKKTTSDPVPNGKRRQQQYPYEHQTKKQKNISMVDDDLDFVRVKPQNQVPILNFWAAMEPYFRPLTEDDRAYLLEKRDNDHKLYEIPPLGKYYRDQWEDERILNADDTSSRRSRYPSSLTDEDNIGSQYDTAGNTLLGRLMSSLVPESFEMDDMSAEDDDDDDDNDSPMSTDDEDKIITEVEVVNTDHINEEPDTSGLEERLKRELQYIGLLDDDNDDDEMDWHAREDDEISAHLRRLGRELQEQMKVNEFRKGRLLQVVDTQLQYDQYRQLLDVLDVQVEQSYLKRFRVQKAKKRKSGSAPKAALSEHTLQAMDKRTKCVTHFGAIFKDKNLVLPTKSIYDEDSI